MRLVPASVLAMGCACVGGCGSSGSSDSAPAAAPATTAAAPATAAPVAGKVVAIGMRGLQFTIPKATVKLGQTVCWTDLEDIPHNVTADAGASFKSSTFGKGATFSYKPAKAGTIKYECTIHPGMVGTLTVVK